MRHRIPAAAMGSRPAGRSPRKDRRRFSFRAAGAQRGAMMLEVLIAILLLSFGILGIVALQTTMTGNLSDARYRAEAALLGEQLIGTMWSDIPGLTSYRYNDSLADCSALTQTAHSVLANWLGSAGTVGTVYGLPDGRAKVSVDADNVVDIMICWKAPNESTWHRYSTTTQIRN